MLVLKKKMSYQNIYWRKCPASRVSVRMMPILLRPPYLCTTPPIVVDGRVTLIDNQIVVTNHTQQHQTKIVVVMR
jgi:hypothetical protein